MQRENAQNMQTDSKYIEKKYTQRTKRALIHPGNSLSQSLARIIVTAMRNTSDFLICFCGRVPSKHDSS